MKAIIIILILSLMIIPIAVQAVPFKQYCISPDVLYKEAIINVTENDGSTITETAYNFSTFDNCDYGCEATKSECAPTPNEQRWELLWIVGIILGIFAAIGILMRRG